MVSKVILNFVLVFLEVVVASFLETKEVSLHLYSMGNTIQTMQTVYGGYMSGRALNCVSLMNILIQKSSEYIENIT